MHKRTIQRRINSKYRQKALSHFYNFPIEETYNLELTIVEFSLPRLIAFREHTISYPPEISYEEWKSILGEIIEGFTIYKEKDTFDYSEEDLRKVEKALDLFRKWFRDLWW